MGETFAGRSRQTCGLFLLAFVLRLALALGFPAGAGDSPVYESFAQNLLRFGTYSHADPAAQSPPRPTMIRTPGYPLMLAAVFAVAGKDNETAVRVVQAGLDTFTCLLIAVLVFESCHDSESGRRLAQWALLMAAMCPFVANYSAAILAEVPATLLWTAAMLCGLRALKGRAPARNWLYCGLLIGGATLFRPESGILAAILGTALVLKEGARRSLRPAVNGCLVMGAGLILVLLPWTIRNALSFRTFQPLAPKYAEDQGTVPPVGYFQWCMSWIWRYPDIATYWWPLEENAIPEVAPPGADSDQQRRDILDVIKRHNASSYSLDRESDDRLAAIARQRRQLHPLRHYIVLPVLRAAAMWFTPRVELLGLEGRLTPIARVFDEDPVDFTFTWLLFLANCAYVALAVWGAGRILRTYRTFEDATFLMCFTLLAVIIGRTAFFAYSMLPEPRYILESYPAVIALGAFVFNRKSC